MCVHGANERARAPPQSLVGRVFMTPLSKRDTTAPAANNGKMSLRSAHERSTRFTSRARVRASRLLPFLDVGRHAQRVRPHGNSLPVCRCASCSVIH